MIQTTTMYDLGGSRGMLVRVDFQFIDDLLYMRDTLGQRAGFVLLMGGLDRPGKNERAILGFGVDALIVKALMRLDRCREVILNSAIKLGIDGAGLALRAGRAN